MSTAADNRTGVEEALRSNLRRAVVELTEARRTIAEMDAASAEPVAVVAMACRLPGGADTPERLWQLVDQGRDVVGPMPDDRGWDVSVDGGYTQRGGFLSGIGDFDAEFFGVGPREALAMDPQQRILLELSWEVLERAGIDPRGHQGSDTGVYIGVTLNDYADRLRRSGTDTGSHLLTGNASSVVSGRVAYALGLRGPAVTVDAACASSLVTIHDAAAALRSGEISMAIAGGVTTMSTTLPFSEFAKMGGLSDLGRCRSFAEGADGIVWSEGAGVVLLERLSDARRNGHPVLGLIRGSAVNQDGASSSLSTPNGPAQQHVIESALEAAGLGIDDVDAVEAHGTGTPLGDPIEANALLATYGRRETNPEPLWLGSVKSNIGHTQAAAGITGLIKMILAMRHERLPASLYSEQPSQHVDWPAGAVRLLQQARAWPSTGRPRRAAVSSFGISGTNAHVILEQAPEPGGAVDVDARGAQGEGHDAARGGRGALGATASWFLSARNGSALCAQADRLAAFVAEQPDIDPDLLGAALAARTAFDTRAVVLAGDAPRRINALRALAEAVPTPEVVTGTAVRGAEKVVLVFPGQGGQWPGMARRLMVSSPVFATEIARCAEALAPYVSWSLTDVLAATDDAWLDQVDVVQPVLFAMMLALAECWRALGVTPTAVLGHSQGEITAAVVAGVLSREDGARVVALRSLALRELAGSGGLVAVEAPPLRVQELLDDLPSDLSIAVVNGPLAVVVGGGVQSLEQFTAVCTREGLKARPVAVDYASHTPHTEVLRAQLLVDLAGITPKQSAVAFYSTVHAAPFAGERLDADYWFRNLREPVEFARTVDAALADGFTTFLECSPHPLLTAAIQDVADTADHPAVGAICTLRRDEDGPERLLRSAAELFVRGVPVAWPRPQGTNTSALSPDLPTYPFQRTRHWPTSVERPGSDATSLGLTDVGHGILGAALTPDPDHDSFVLTGQLSMSTSPWLADHRVHERPLLPGAAFVECALRAGELAGTPELAELTLHTPLFLPEHGSVSLRVRLGTADGDGARPVRIHARLDDGPEGEWTLHAEGLLAIETDPPANATDFDLVDWPPPGATPVPLDDIYDTLADRGYQYGPTFQGLRAAWRRGDDVYTEVALPESAGESAGRFGVHPALLDAALHGSIFTSGAEQVGTAVPFAWSGVRLRALDASSLRVRITALRAGSIALAAADTSGVPVLTIDELVVQPLPQPEIDSLYQVDWVPLPAAAPGRKPQLLALAGRGPGPGGDLTDTITELAGQLRELLHDAASDTRSAVVTRQGALVVARDRAALDPVAAAVAGFVRSVQAEFPGRLLLVDVSADDLVDDRLLASLAGYDEPELAVRDGRVHGRRLVAARPGAALPDARRGWHLEAGASGSLQEIHAVESDTATRELTSHEVRINVWYTGVTFRDGLLALGLYPHAAPLGAEGAGVVTAVGPSVDRVRVGQPVMGVMFGSYGPEAVTDERLLAPVPAGLSLAEAATIPLAFLTAHRGLITLGGIRPGARVLVHAATGGVGMAAVQLARVHGAEVFATASPAKWPVLRAMGLDDDHIASSRDTSFEDRFAAVTRGAGMDVVLNSLTGELTEASLRLLPRGGVFAEAGKLDLRDADLIAAAYPGVSYRPFETLDGGLDETAAVFDELVDGFARTNLRPLPLTGWELADLPAALTALTQAHHIGKLVTRTPQPAAEHGSVLITGGTGLVGGLVAEHLAQHQRVRRLILLSRQGPRAELAAELRGRLEQLGAEVDIVACDVTDREQLAAVIAAIPPERPLTGVVHAAAAVEDGLLESVNHDRLATVLGAKASAAWHLHELTAQHNLSLFTLFSSMAGVTAGAGQAGYAAANAYVDALAQWRAARGLPAKSIAWGRWETASGITGRLSEADVARMSRAGLLGMSTEQGLALFDAAHRSPAAALAAARLDRGVWSDGNAPALFSTLAPHASKPVRKRPSASAGPSRSHGTAGGETAARLVGLEPGHRKEVLVGLVRSHAAIVLGHQQSDAVDIDRSFRDLGFDSLASVELRNRLSTALGLRLTPAVVFDNPTPGALAEHLAGRFATAAPADAASLPVARQGAALAGAAAPGRESIGWADLLLRQAIATAALPEFLHQMAELARFAPVPSDREVRPPVRLVGRTGSAPTYLCLPSLFGKSSYESFWQLAEALADGPEVDVAAHLGYTEGEPLPGSAQEALRVHTDAILANQSANEPFVLVGYSSAAPLAYTLAAALHARGLPPTGTVLIDPYTLRGNAVDRLGPLLEELARRNEELGDLGGNWALAMARYGTFDWSAESPATADAHGPVLLLRASHGDARSKAYAAECAEAFVDAKVIDIDADHFSVLGEQVGRTAAVISEWVGALLEK